MDVEGEKEMMLQGFGKKSDKPGKKKVAICDGDTCRLVDEDDPEAIKGHAIGGEHSAEKSEEDGHMHEEEEEEEEHGGGELWTLKVKTNLPDVIEVPVMESDTLDAVADFIKDVLPYDLVKFIFKGKVLAPSTAAGSPSSTIKELGLSNGALLKLLASTSSSVQKVLSTRSDPTIRGFKDEERLYNLRKKRAAGATEEQDPTYRFCKFQVLSVSEATKPHPFEAERLLRKLAGDPGIIFIMKKHKFTVGILREMSPDEAYARKKAAEGGCLLGYNENAGASISIRLRHDDISIQEFRGYKGLINTLLHELSHNSWGEHDENFWRLFALLKTEYLTFHAEEARQGKIVEGRTATSKFNLDSESISNVGVTVENQLRQELGNGALSAHERSGVAQVVSEIRTFSTASSAASSASYPPVKKELTRERLARAAEERFRKQQQDQQKQKQQQGGQDQAKKGS